MSRFYDPPEYFIINNEGKGYAFRRKQLSQASRNFKKIARGRLGNINLIGGGSLITVKNVERLINEIIKECRQLNKEYYKRGRPLPTQSEEDK